MRPTDPFFNVLWIIVEALPAPSDRSLHLRATSSECKPRSTRCGAKNFLTARRRKKRPVATSSLAIFCKGGVGDGSRAEQGLLYGNASIKRPSGLCTKPRNSLNKFNCDVVDGDNTEAGTKRGQVKRGRKNVITVATSGKENGIRERRRGRGGGGGVKRRRKRKLIQTDGFVMKSSHHQITSTSSKMIMVSKKEEEGGKEHACGIRKKPIASGRARVQKMKKKKEKEKALGDGVPSSAVSSFSPSSLKVNEENDSIVPPCFPSSTSSTASTIFSPTLSSPWPDEFVRYSYAIIARGSFTGPLSLVTSGGVGAILAARVLQKQSNLGGGRASAGEGKTLAQRRRKKFPFAEQNANRTRRQSNSPFPTKEQQRQESGDLQHEKEKQRQESGDLQHEKGEKVEPGEYVLKAVLDPSDWAEEITGYHSVPVHHPNIVNLFGVSLVSATEVDKLCCSISKYSARRKGVVPAMVFRRWDGSVDESIRSGEIVGWGLELALRVIADAARGLQFMHENGLVHRDIKPENMLFRLNGQGKMIGALCDLGMVCSVRRMSESGIELFDKEIKDGGCGTRSYMAPECKKGLPYSLPADMYSLAVTVEELPYLYIISYLQRNDGVARAAKPCADTLDPLLRPVVRKGRSHRWCNRPNAGEFLQRLEEVCNELKRLAENRNRQRPGLRDR
eukprot:jgi/Bigna1/146110/aug1.109_g20818